MFRMSNFSKRLLKNCKNGFPPRKLSNLASLKEGDQLSHNWEVVNRTAIPELNLESAIHLKHKNCNAQWLHMENPSDITNAFSVHFKTVPKTSNGVPHILEHCTLCGSKDYPVRDPFMKMLNRSLATMNAMTGPDYTLYPFATPNEKDFYNLMKVYLDAVFNPLLRELDFKQEGWRLDMDKEKGDLVIKGVVFNEMKGAFADAQQVFGQRLLNTILPSDTYGYCSGGLPECIPELSWEELKEFHSVHYSPHNARFYSYGNLHLEGHLAAVDSYMPSSSSNNKDVPVVRSEPRWSSPRSDHVYCPDDPTGNSNTIAVSYLLSPIDDMYETFVLRVLSELLVDGPSAPFYCALIESGLGSAFSPVTGYDSYTKDTGFTVGLQGIDMSKAKDIENVILKTFEEAAEKGFESDRVQAILNTTELGLKKQKDDFGWKLILSLTPGWNHVNDPLALLNINKILDQFKKDIQDGEFLQRKIRQHFLDNNHRLTLTMSPKADYLEEQKQKLDSLETVLVQNLDSSEREKVIEQGRILEDMQSVKDSEEKLSCLPTLTLQDIPLELPRYGGVSSLTLKNNVFGQISSQPTNEVAYTKFRLRTDDLLTTSEKEILPIFAMVMASMGAGSKSYRDMDIAMELHTGSMGASLHLAENPENASELIQRGLMLGATCLERKVPEMFSLWNELFHGLLVPSDACPETSLNGLQARLSDLVSMSAVNYKNSFAHGGHHYAMTHAASKLTELPALADREKQSGISKFRLLSSFLDDKSKIADLLTKLSIISRKLLTASNIETFSISCTPQKSETIVKEFEFFMDNLPKDKTEPHDQCLVQDDGSISKDTYFASPFPVHFSSIALNGVHYTHPDAAPLRVLSRLLSSKYLHVEIREKGGAYGGGCSANPTSSTISFYSYRDPNFERTIDTFHSSNDWIQKGKESFNQTDVDEAKLSVFKGLDKPVLPGARGQRIFLSGITDEQFEEHRKSVRNVTFADVQRVSQDYLGNSRKKAFSTTLGPETAKPLEGHQMESLLS